MKQNIVRNLNGIYHIKYNQIKYNMEHTKRNVAKYGKKERKIARMKPSKNTRERKRIKTIQTIMYREREMKRRKWEKQLLQCWRSQEKKNTI